MPPGSVVASAAVKIPSGWLLCDGSVVDQSAYPFLFDAVGTTYNVGGEGSTQFRLPNLKGKVIVMQDTAQAEFDVLGKTSGEKAHTLTTAESPAHSHQYGHTHGMNTVDTNHAHNVYSRDINHDHAINHWHYASIGQVKAWSGFSHQHVNSGGYAAEGAEQGSAGAGSIPVNVDGNANAAPGGNNISGGMRQSNPHDHPSTNYASESPWAGNYTHTHSTNSQSSSTSDNGTGGGAAHNNLQPYLVMNYLIKV